MSSSDSSTWVLAQASQNGRPLLIRFRQFPTGCPNATYPERINILWKLSDPDENGLPGDEEFDRLADFEDRLIAAVEHDEHSILTVVLSHDGKNEFVFYTGSAPVFIERLTSITEGAERYPISIQQYADANWSYFQSVIPENIRPMISPDQEAL